MADWGKIAATVGPLVAGYLSSRQSKKSAEQASGGARLQTLMPQIMAMMQQQQQNSATNYQMQTQQHQANLPLQDAVRRMAMNLTPNHLKTAPSGGGSMAAPGMSAAPSAPAAPMQATGDFLDDYQRRGGGTGGALSGAATGASLGGTVGSVVPVLGTAAGMGIGAGVGAIAGAVNKHAKTAPTDFAVGDAQQAIMRAIQAYQGRAASPQEIESILRGQGWESGDKWVGDGSMRYVLNQLQGQGR